MPRRPTVPREDGPDIPEKPEVKTLEWHIRKFAQQQKEWQLIQNVKDSKAADRTHAAAPYTYPSTIPIDLNKPLPMHPASHTKDNHNVSKVFNPGFSHTHHIIRADQFPGGPEPLNDRFIHAQHAGKAIQGNDNVSLDLSKNPHKKVHIHDRGGVEKKHVKQAQPPSNLPASLVAGRNVEEQAYRKQSKSEAGDCGILGVHLSVNDFRSTLPEELQPKEPTLRWESELAPQIPVVLQKCSSFQEDDERVQSKPKGGSGVKLSDRELLPSALASKEGTDLLSKK